MHHFPGICRRFFVGSHTSVADAEVAALVADLLAADKGHTRSLLPKLHKLYCASPDARQVPPIEMLQHPKVRSNTNVQEGLRRDNPDPVCMTLGSDNAYRHDVPKLHKLYCTSPDARQVPPIQMLQHPKVRSNTTFRQCLWCDNPLAVAHDSGGL